MASKDKEPGSKTQAASRIRGSNQSALRDHNERLILTLLRSAGPKPKAEIARMSGLSPQTASVIMRNLEMEGLIERCAPVRGKVGQPSIPMQLADNGALFFGLKIGRRSADLVLIDFRGRIISRVHSTYQYPTPEGTLRFVTDAVDRLTNQLPEKQRKRIAGLGVAIPSYLWEWTGIIGIPIERMAVWRDRDICSEIDACFDFPVFGQNDASCACGAELVFGTREPPPDFLYLFVGFFVGGGIVLNNRLITGPTGNAGALGTLPCRTSDGPTRQLVEVASLSSLEKLVRESGGDTSAIWESSSSWNVDQKLLRKWLGQTADGLAQAIVASCSVIDFPLVLVDGWMPEQIRRDLVDLITKKLLKFNFTGLVRPDIREGSIGPDARSLGAASLPLSSRFLIS